MRISALILCLGVSATSVHANALVQFSDFRRTVFDSPSVVVFELRSTEAFSTDVAIPVTINSSSAVAGIDYNPPPALVIFPAGATTSFLRLQVLGNPGAVGDRGIEFALTNPPPGVTLGPNDRLQVTLVKALGASYYTFGKDQYHVNEAAGMARVRVQRVGDVSHSGSVTCSIAAGTATGADADLGTATLDFAAGESEAALPIALHDNSVAQDNRYLQLSLPSLPDHPEGLTASAQLVIVDNDKLTGQSVSIKQYQKGGVIDVYEITFHTQAGFLYAVEAAEAPVSGPWSALQVIVGDGEIHSAVDIRPMTDTASRFYRYRIEDDPATR